MARLSDATTTVTTGAVTAYSLWHVRHRPVISDLGRWMSRDPLGYTSTTIANLIDYCFENPVGRTDSTGLFPPPMPVYGTQSKGYPCNQPALCGGSNGLIDPELWGATDCNPLNPQQMLVCICDLNITAWSPSTCFQAELI